jgi:hypothetical protein
MEQVIINNRWWKGVVENDVIWSPNSVPPRRDLWANIYGVPLQCWGGRCFSGW